MHYYRRQAYEVVAICLGQPLAQGLIIHHCDENPKNNDPSNLLLFRSLAEHTAFHQRLLERQAVEPGVDTTLLALESGAIRLPAPPAPIVLPPYTDPPAPSKRKASPASARTRSEQGQWRPSPQQACPQ